MNKITSIKVMSTILKERIKSIDLFSIYMFPVAVIISMLEKCRKQKVPRNTISNFNKYFNHDK